MPIFQDAEQCFFIATQPSEPCALSTVKPKYSDESIWTEFCDGPLPDAPISNTVENEGVDSRKEEQSCNQGGVCTSDRNELMERIKRGESPTWIPSQTLQEEYSKTNHEGFPSTPSTTIHHESTSLLPAAQFERNDGTDSGACAAELSPPSEIKRPRSALHAGDFNGSSQDAPAASQKISVACEPSSPSAQGIIGVSPTTPGYDLDQRSQYTPTPWPSQDLSAPQRSEPISLRSRAPSLNSHSSNFVAKAPTTPLVQQSNNTDLDFSPIDLSISKSTRRHTLPPRPLHGREFSTSGQRLPFASAAHQTPSLRRDTTFPFQTHRSRRSLTTTYSLQASSSPQRPTFLHSRRKSLSSEASPLHNASMVGSYEESILRGWMSTAPSKPLDFTAQIGVLGRSKCKPKCPAHVTVPFPAVFYSWSGGTGGKPASVEDEPSPYVGHIDLQQLPTPAESKKSRRSRSKSPPVLSDPTTAQNIPPAKDGEEVDHTIRPYKKRRRVSPAPLALQGGYRIPQKGQLQIVIKNPNKTAVKLFLVPYDLEDMEAGTKTFIRQRCYSTDLVIEGVPAKSTPKPIHPTPGSSAKGKSTLRYLIHVNICSPSSGRFYLYQHIRVVFANRVPDNKEQLQTGIQVPQPRYSPYNPNFSLSRSVSSSGAGLAKEKVYRRRSSGFGVGHEGMDDRHPRAFSSGTSCPFKFDSPPSRPPSVPRVPLHLANTQGVRTELEGLTHHGHRSSECRSAGAGEAPLSSALSRPPASPIPATSFRRLSIVRQRPRASGLENHQLAGFEPMDPEKPIPGFEPYLLSDDTDGSAMDIDISTTRSYHSPLSDRTNRYYGNPRFSNLSDRSKCSNEAYSKLSKGDAGYGGRSSTPEPGEGLLARKLRGMGVQRADSTKYATGG